MQFKETPQIWFLFFTSSSFHSLTSSWLMLEMTSNYNTSMLMMYIQYIVDSDCHREIVLATRYDMWYYARTHWIMSNFMFELFGCKWIVQCLLTWILAYGRTPSLIELKSSTNSNNRNLLYARDVGMLSRMPCRPCTPFNYTVHRVRNIHI